MISKRIAPALVLTAIGAVALAAPASAGSTWRKNDIDKREASQKGHIVAGRKDGGLTWLEKWRLNREQRRIGSLQRRAVRDDGYVSKSEHREIRAAQKDAARHIYTERHDGQTRGFWWRNFVR